MAYWLIKSEPDVYSWDQLCKDKKAVWDGVRNFEARNNLRAMQKGDLCLYYHSNIGKEIVGIAKVSKTAYPDKTAEAGEDWSVVEVTPSQPFNSAVTLAAIKADKALVDLSLLRRSRLSVVPVSEVHFRHLLKMGQTKLKD